MGESPGGWLVEEGIRRLLLGIGGEPLGQPARRGSKVRRVNGGEAEAEKLFEGLARLGHDDPIPNLPFRRVVLPGGGHAVYRPVSKSGEPTIDVNVKIEGLGNVKFKFVESEEV